MAKEQKKKSITAQDYGYLSRLVLAELKRMTIGARGYKEANDLYNLLKDKAKKGDTVKSSSTKSFAKWKCLDCNAIHEKVETEHKCLTCGSTSVKKEAA